MGSVPDGVDVLAWDLGDSKPDGLERTEFWVPPVEHPFDVQEMLHVMPALKVIQLTSAGVDDVKGDLPDGLTLCDARGVHGSAVAELAVLMILALQRRLPDFLASQSRGVWQPAQSDDLRGKRVVIIGAGDLGEQTARRLRSFDAVPVLVAASARDGVHAITELPDLLPEADMVVLTLPLTRRTEGMVDAAFLAQLADGAVLINVSRGKIVDTQALLAELQSGRLRAGLDVVEPEPLPAGHPLWDAPHLILTPHAAGNIAQSGPRALALVHDQLRRYCEGTPLINVVHGDY
ncbi:2-hydroxyacid dehydrogenase [Acidothermaceae bacterium B102]|nr:2-hydroxyacid dehydrogenase [Acidothermaceae bacterium B102]